MTEGGIGVTPAGGDADAPRELRGYLQARPALVEVMLEARRRLRSLGDARGEILLESRQAREAVEGLGAPVHGRPPRLRVRLSALDAAWRASRFACSLRAACGALDEAPLVTRREEQEWLGKAAATYRTMLAGMAEELGPTGVAALRMWETVDPSRANTLGRAARRQATPEMLAAATPPAAGFLEAVPEFGHVATVLWALAALPAALAVPALPSKPQSRADPETDTPQHTSILLPVLAARSAGDPHALDLDRPAGRLLLSVLALLSPGFAHETGDPASRANGAVADLTRADARAALYATHGIALDALSSTVAVWGLGEGHPVPTAAREARVPLVLPLASLDGHFRIEPLTAAGGVVWVVENPAVFQVLVGIVRNWPVAEQPTLVCGSGFLSLAALRLLDAIAGSGSWIAYSGDLDPNGILIAEMIWRRWPAATVLWRMPPAPLATRGDENDSGNRALPEGLREVEGLVRPNADSFAALRRLVAESGTQYQEAFLDFLQRDLRSVRLRPQAPGSLGTALEGKTT